MSGPGTTRVVRVNLWMASTSLLAAFLGVSMLGGMGQTGITGKQAPASTPLRLKAALQVTG